MSTEETKKDVVTGATPKKTTAKKTSTPKVVSAENDAFELMKKQMEAQQILLEKLSAKLNETEAENMSLKTVLVTNQEPKTQIITPEPRRIRVFCTAAGINNLSTRDGNKVFKFTNKNGIARMSTDDLDQVISYQEKAFKAGLFRISREDKDIQENDYPFLMFIEDNNQDFVSKDVFEASKSMTHEELNRLFLGLSTKGKKAFINDWLTCCADDDRSCLVSWKLSIFCVGDFRNDPQLIAVRRQAEKLESKENK